MRHMLNVCAALCLMAPSWSGDAPDFAREVLPVLAEHCFDCHGSHKPKSDLSLSTRSGAFADETIIKPRDSAHSELYKRLVTSDPDDVMPQKKERLSAQEIATIKTWIDTGAEWPKDLVHWSYMPPKKVDVPNDLQPIDYFVRRRLAAHDLKPAPMADRATLVRRLHLDLTGLPPSPAAVAEFLSDGSADAYERLVDKLLASPQFGVRWARPWLDLARYADSHGFQRDDLRELWPYRDWVVNALNNDMPFTDFTIAQLAGDLLPNPTTEQLIATGFNRSAPCNVEAGTDPEENRVNQVFDRVNTLGAVWLGTTLECAQCHDHKYDPISQQEYFELFACFNQTAIEADRKEPKVLSSIKFNGPFLTLADEEQRAKLKELQDIRENLAKAQRKRQEELEKQFDEFVASLQKGIENATKAQVLKPTQVESFEGSTHTILPDDSVLFSDANTPSTDTYTFTVTTTLPKVTGIQIEALTDPSLPGMGPGRGDEMRPNFVLNKITVTAAPSDAPERAVPLTFTRAHASFSQDNYPVDSLLNVREVNPKKGWSVFPQFFQPHWAIFENDTSFAQGESTTFVIKLVQNYGGGRTMGRIRISALSGPATQAVVNEDIIAWIKQPKKKWTAKQKKQIIAYQHTQDDVLCEIKKALTGFDADIKKMELNRTLVMKEITKPRMNRILKRGVFNDYGDEVSPGVPAVLHQPEQPIKNRLDLARWLVDKRNPITARVVVNRLWATLFGRGIVATVEDFGVKGDLPTHPDLLDWLAVEFMERNWSMKNIIRTIVLSETYRQSSHITQDALAKDDQNKWLARGSRFRLDAEAIRDNALSIAGLINVSLGGEPIRPPQPKGLWDKLGGEKYDYIVSPGTEQYRRGLYVVLKRSAPYPSFINFDSSARLACVVKRSRSNTPLQALTLLNDPVYVEAAQQFAKRIVAENANKSLTERIDYAYHVALARAPSDREVHVLSELHKKIAASKDDMAGYIAIATALLNLDETITKE